MLVLGQCGGPLLGSLVALAERVAVARLAGLEARCALEVVQRGADLGCAMLYKY